MKTQDLKVQENKARRQLRKQERLLHKPRGRDGYMIIDARLNAVIFGGDALLSLEDVFYHIDVTEDFLDHAKEQEEISEAIKAMNR